MNTSQRAVAEVMERTGMNQTELAAALNVSQSLVSQWVAGKREPSPAARAAFDKVMCAGDVIMEETDVGLWTGAVRVPKEVWSPAFTPLGKFRLPLRLDWSGTADQRWTDARDIDCLLATYTQIMVDGRNEDIVMWIDPVLLSRNIDRVLFPRGYESVWRAALQKWGL